MSYLIRRAVGEVSLAAGFDSPCWAECETMHIKLFRSEGSDHRPRVRLKLQYDTQGLYGLFAVEDRYVRCVAEKFQDMVCFDSCVEFFVQPAVGTGFVNFEMNASGVLLCQLVKSHLRRAKDSLRFLTKEEIEGVRIFHTMPDRIEPETAGPVNYEVGFFIPFTLFRKTHNAPAPTSGTAWRANAYKCGDHTSHPHWVSWQPLNRLSFHNPDYFGKLEFE